MPPFHFSYLVACLIVSCRLIMLWRSLLFIMGLLAWSENTCGRYELCAISLAKFFSMLTSNFVRKTFKFYCRICFKFYLCNLMRLQFQIFFWFFINILFSCGNCFPCWHSEAGVGSLIALAGSATLVMRKWTVLLQFLQFNTPNFVIASLRKKPYTFQIFFKIN